MKLKKSIVYVVLIVAGFVTPFIRPFIVWEVFVLLIPLAILFLVGLVYLIITLATAGNIRQGIFVFSIVPAFVLSQALSVFVVDKVQRYQSKNVIVNINHFREEMGEYPAQYDTPPGLYYYREPDKKDFRLEYSRGFLVTEKFDSHTGEWKSYGWND